MPEDLRWRLLRNQHTSAIRDWLAAKQPPDTAKTTRPRAAKESSLQPGS